MRWYRSDSDGDSSPENDLVKCLIVCAVILVFTVVVLGANPRETLGEGIFLGFLIVAWYLRRTVER